MVHREAVLIAPVGGILGVGVLLGWVVVRVLADQRITEFALPVFRLVATVFLAGACGLLAATLPARHGLAYRRVAGHCDRVSKGGIRRLRATLTTEEEVSRWI